MLAIGLTGSLASGKSTVAAMFAEAGAAIFNADAAVHALYAGKAAPLIEAAFPGTTANGIVDRKKLGARVVGDEAALKQLEKLVHPLVREADTEFCVSAVAAGRRVAVIEIPLLFETGGESRFTLVAMVDAPEALRRERYLRRPGATAERFAALTARQTPDDVKRRGAHFIIDTSGDYAATRKQVQDVMRAVAGLAAAR